MTLKSLVLPIALSATSVLGQGSHPFASADYDRQIRENAPKFHRNFSAGNFDANGPLVTEGIEVNSNNVQLTGRQNFVNRLKRYSVPFPGLQLRDRMLVVDGNVAGVLYLLQGKQNGLYGATPATGNKIEAMSGEVFEFDEHALMKKLTTITKLDDVAAEVKGTLRVSSYQSVTLIPSRKESPDYEKRVRAAASALHANQNARRYDANSALLAPTVMITSGESQSIKGAAAFREWSRRYDGAFQDMQIHDEYVLVEGNHAVVEYIMSGTQTGPLHIPGKRLLPPTGKEVHVRGIRFLTFNPQALISEIAEVVNYDDFAAQLAPKS